MLKQKTVYFREEDLPLWEKIPNKAEWLHEHLNNPMTGREWYDRFERQYHMSADWISGDKEMGDDAEHDILSAALRASKLETVNNPKYTPPEQTA